MHSGKIQSMGEKDFPDPPQPRNTGTVALFLTGDGEKFKYSNKQAAARFLNAVAFRAKLGTGARS